MSGRRFRFMLPVFAFVAACSGGGEAASAAQPGQIQTAGAAAQKPLPPGAWRVKRTVLMDRNGFEKPLPAMTMLIPADWSGDGGVVWGQNTACGGGSGYTVQYSAASPDGRSGLQILPSFNWSWNNIAGPQGAGGCPFLRIGNVRQYLEYFVSQTRPGARVIDFRPRNDVADKYKMFNSSTPMVGGDMRIWVEAGEVLVAYNAGGVDTRETIGVVAMFSRSYMEGGMGMPASEFLSGAALSGFAMRAPNGQLDFAFAEMVRNSGRPEPEWSARIAEHNAKIARTNLKGARDRSAIIAQTGEEIRQMQNDTWRRQNESSDRMQRESVEAIRGVETYNDPYYGGTVQLDHTYDNAWQLGDGSYVLTNDVMFEPMRDLGVEGQKLEVAQ